MPGLDRTGPEGKGSQTGRGLGKCNPNNQKTDEQLDEKEFPAGRGRGAGNGLGRRSRFRGGNGNGPGGRRFGRGNS